MKYAEYIKSIEITALWGKRKHIMWNLDRSVNILSGINGVGKSTILSKIIHSIGDGGALKIESSPSVKVTLVPEDATHIRYNVIRSLDSPVLDLGTMAHVDSRITSALDFQLYHLQRKYLDYQVKVGNKIIEELQQGNASAAQLLSEKKRCFQDIVDDLFKATGKKIVRTENEIRFDQMGEILVPYQLSSGEKQILAILLTVLVENEEPYVLFMDEPEVSLHVEWQERLVELILKLNPKVQIILTTHSPALIMNGWMDKVTEVTDITLHE